jgi:hypothetical protein
MRRGNQRGIWGALALAFVLALASSALAGCGNEEETSAHEEGIPIKLGELEFNVQETRYLNPAQPDDSEYLAGQALPPPPEKVYLGVFLTIHNDGDDPVRLPTHEETTVVDTTDAAYQAIPSDTPFAAPLGTELGPGEDVPAEDTAAQTGPVQGALAIFFVDLTVDANRPLTLEIEYQGETGEVTLDI